MAEPLGVGSIVYSVLDHRLRGEIGDMRRSAITGQFRYQVVWSNGKTAWLEPVNFYTVHEMKFLGFACA